MRILFYKTIIITNISPINFIKSVAFLSVLQVLLAHFFCYCEIKNRNSFKN